MSDTPTSVPNNDLQKGNPIFSAMQGFPNVPPNMSNMVASQLHLNPFGPQQASNYGSDTPTLPPNDMQKGNPIFTAMQGFHNVPPDMFNMAASQMHPNAFGPQQTSNYGVTHSSLHSQQMHLLPNLHNIPFVECGVPQEQSNPLMQSQFQTSQNLNPTSSLNQKAMHAEYVQEISGSDLPFPPEANATMTVKKTISINCHLNKTAKKDKKKKGIDYTHSD